MSPQDRAEAAAGEDDTLPLVSRATLAVDPFADPYAYATCPPGATMHGVVTHRGETGALMLVGGTFVRANGATWNPLPAADLAAVLAAARPGRRGGARPGSGPKPADGAVGVRRVNIMLDPISDATARALGDGDRSVGIRRALAKLSHDPSK